MQDSKVKFFMTTAVWGPWHTKMLLETCLPSLLSPNNLPKLSRLVDAKYVIKTSAEDRDAISSSFVVETLRRLMPVTVEVSAEIDTKDPIASHSRIWTSANKEAQEAGAMVMFIIPDLVWADGSMESVARAISGGKRVLYAAFSRAVSETVVPALHADFGSMDGVSMCVSPADLVTLGLQHMHPLTGTYRRDSKIFPVHPQFAIWSVKGEGFLNRYFLGELLVFDPSMELTSAYVLKSVANEGELLFFDRSHDLMALSLSPMDKDTDWYSIERPIDPLSVARWWLDCDSPANDFCVRHNIRFHTGNMTEAMWRRTEQQADMFVQRVFVAREMLRVLDWLTKMEYQGAARLLATALSAGRIASRWPCMGRFVVALPAPLSPNAAATSLEARLLEAGNEGLLNHFIKAHVFALTPELQAVIDDKAAAADVPSMNGNIVRVTRSGDRIAFGRSRAVSGPFAVGENFVYITSHALAGDEPRVDGGSDHERPDAA